MGDLPGRDEHTGECCSLRRTRKFDRKMHIPGRCVVDIGSTFTTCPKLEKFDGVQIISQEGLSHDTWMKKLGKRFYKAYREQGGQERLKKFLRSRWSL